MTKQQAKHFSSNTEAGYLIYAQPIDVNKPTQYKQKSFVRIVLQTPNKTKLGEKHYSQRDDQDLIANDIHKLHERIYKMRWNKIK